MTPQEGALFDFVKLNVSYGRRLFLYFVLFCSFVTFVFLNMLRGMLYFPYTLEGYEVGQ